MSEIQLLLEADSKNVEATKQLYADYHPYLTEALDEAAALFKTLSRAYGQKAKDDADSKMLNDLADRYGISGADELRSLIESPPPNDPAKLDFLSEFNELEHRWMSRRVRGMLLLLSFRCYMFAATDLFRIRISSAIGHLRVQVEAVALMNMICKKPDIASEWIKISNHKEGKRFFRSHPIRDFIDKHDLAHAWNLASGSAQHARFASIVYGLAQVTSQKDHRRIDQYNVVFQEGEPHERILYTLFLLRTQYQLFIAIREGLEEVEDPLLINTRFPNFKSKVEFLWKRLEEVFPEKVKLWKEKAFEYKEGN